MELLSGWYPGLGEVETIRRMSPIIRQFISDAAEENPDFVEDYLLPSLEDYDPEEKILADLQHALCDLEFEAAGLGEVGNLGKSFLKKVAKAVRKVHEKVTKAVLPKPLRKIEEKVHKIATKTGRKVEKAAGKIMKKYGSIILTVAGAVLAPFTGGASLAVASVLAAANTAYQKKAAARKAKAMAARNAGQLSADAQQQQAAAAQQVDQFYAQNQRWFVDNLGLTPDKWGQLTFDQKVDILQHGMRGTVPGAAPAPQPGEDGGGGPAPYGGGGGSGPTPSGGGGGAQGPDASGTAPGQKVATAGMFDSSMIPLLGVGVVLAVAFGKPAKGKGRRARRNPSRRYYARRMRRSA